MINPDEQLQIALEVMQRLGVERTMLPPNPAPDAYLRPDPPSAGRPLPSLAGLIREIGPQPPYSALVGLCDDGLPFLLDLSDPSPGSILIAGDRGSGKTRQLQAILASAGALNQPEEVCYTVITPRPAEFELLQSQAHCLDVLTPGERAACALVLDYAEIANQRRTGRETGALLVLAVDDLAALDRYLDDKATRYLQWLLQHGPSVGIWTFASLEAGRARELDRRLLPAFGTRFIGKIASPGRASDLTGCPEPVVEALEGGRQFCVLFGNEWIRFWIPELR